MHSLLKLTKKTNQKILSLIDSKQWDKILVLSNERDLYLRQYFALSPLPDNNVVISKLVIEMTNLDDIVKEKIKVHKSALINEGLSLKKNHHAISQYTFTNTTLIEQEFSELTFTKAG
jgi:hypothetical protein